MGMQATPVLSLRTCTVQAAHAPCKLFEEARLQLHRQDITGSTMYTSLCTSVQRTAGTAALSTRSLQGTLVACEPH